MKKIFRYWACMLITAVVAFGSSCAETDPAMESIPYGRVLTPLEFEATVVATSGTDVTFKWQKMQNAEAYELELFAAVDGYAGADYDAETPLEQFVVESGQIPFTLTGLEVDTDYYARVRGTSSKIESSNWAYLKKAFSTYPVRETLNPVVVKRTDSAVTIGWDDAEDKDDLNAVHVEAVTEGGEVMKFQLTEDEIAACSRTIDGLEAATEYKFTLIFGKAGERGAVTAWTRPQTGKATRVSSAAEIAAAIDGAQSAVELLVAYSDAAYDFTTNDGNAKTYTLTAPLTIYGETSESGKKPVLSNIAFTLNPGAASLHLEDLNLDGGKSGGATVTMTAGDYTAVEVVNCELYDYTKGIYSVGDSAAANVDKLLFKGLYVHDINANGKEGGDFIDIRCGLHKDIEIANSTFYACARTFLRVSNSAKSGSVAVHNCTFNYVAVCDVKDNAGLFAIRVVTEPQSIVCEKCVFLNEYSDGEDETGFVRLTRNSTDSHAPVCDGNFYYNVGPAWWVGSSTLIEDGTPFSEEIGMKNGSMLSIDPCVNSQSGKMYLAAGSPIAKAGVGDPRWWNAAEPKVERAKTLETVTEPTVWDFTDKAKFDNETVEANTIIENIRILAPAEVVMGKGIVFDGAATVNDEGVPTARALAFKAEGIGSVKVTTLDGGYNASVHVVAGGDRYTLPADGNEHTVPFGDIQGENDIYVLAGSAVTITRIEWSSDLTPDRTKSALDTPRVAMSVSSFEVGNDDNIAVTASWSAVENAADYVVTFNGTTETVTAASYTISAADAAALAVGEYTVSVVARPVPTSSKYADSEAGEASFVVKEKPVAGGTTVWTWDFASAAWQAEFAKIGTANTDIENWNLTFEGLTLYSKAKSKYNTTYFQWGGKGSTSDRYLKFTAPAAGTLKVWSSNTGGSEDQSREVTVQAGDKVTSHPGGSPSGTLTENTYEITEAGEVYIYCSGNALRFYKVEFTFVDGSAAPAEPTVWDFASTEWQAEFAKYGAANTDITDWNLTYDGLTLYSANKSKYNTTYFQWGGKGSTDDRYLKFTAASAGTLKVWSSNTGGSEDQSREVTVQAGGKATSHPGGSPSGTLTENAYEITEAGEVLIYCSGNALRFYKVEFSGGVEK